MKVLILGKNPELVSSAHASEKALGLVYVVNALEKQSYFHRQGGSCLLWGVDEYKTTNPSHETFLVYNEADSGETIAECEVVFVAENEHEENLMKCGVSYDQRCKDQFVSILVRDALEEHVMELGCTPRDDDYPELK